MKKKNTVFMAVAMTILMIGWVATAWAGGNPPNPGDEKTAGPVVRGTFEFFPSETANPDSPVAWSFYGTCKGEDITIENVLHNDINVLEDVSEETLINQRFGDLSGFPNKCVPKNAYDLIVSKIRSFEEFDEMKVAEVMLFFVVPK